MESRRKVIIILLWTITCLLQPSSANENYIQKIKEVIDIAEKRNENFTMMIGRRILEIIMKGKEVPTKIVYHAPDCFRLKSELVEVTDSIRDDAYPGDEKYLLFLYEKDSVSSFVMALYYYEGKKIRLRFNDGLRKILFTIEIHKGKVKYVLGYPPSEEILGIF